MISKMPLESRIPFSIVMIIIFAGMGVHLFSNPDFGIAQDVRTIIFSILFAIAAVTLFVDAYKLIKMTSSLMSKIINVGLLFSTLLFVISLIIKVVQIA
jgi:hypothetical protein